MLIVTRKCQEVVVVSAANGIERLFKVTVLGIKNGKVRLGFEADEDVSIARLGEWKQLHAIRPRGGKRPPRPQCAARISATDETPHQEQLKRIAAACRGRDLIVNYDLIEALEKQLAEETSQREALEFKAELEYQRADENDLMGNQLQRA
jgi:carbon storage regulator CsrA